MGMGHAAATLIAIHFLSMDLRGCAGGCGCMGSAVAAMPLPLSLPPPAPSDASFARDGAANVADTTRRCDDAGGLVWPRGES